MANDDLRWETLDRRSVHSSPRFDIYKETVRFPDGHKDEFSYLSENEAVVVLPFTSEENVVVIDQWRHAVKRISRSLPVGSIEAYDDDPEAAARRELAEETGYEAGTLEHLTTVEPVNGISDSILHYFVAQDCIRTAEQELEDNESIHVRITTLEDLLESAKENELRDGRSVMGVLYYELFEQ